jgi:Ca2+-binding EF-hand superfamily protein
VVETSQSKYQSIQQAAGSMALARSQNRVQNFQTSTRIPSGQQTREVSPGLIAEKSENEQFGLSGDPKKGRKSYRKKSPSRDGVNKYVKTSKGKPIISFLESLYRLIEEERSLEECRRHLIAQPDFFTEELFRMVDRRNRGSFTFDEFRYFLSTIGVSSADTHTIIDLYSAFDSSQSCLLTIEELTEMVIPREPQIATTIKTSPGPGYAGMSPATRDLVKTCFSKLFSLRKVLGGIKQEISSSQTDLNAIFEQLDSRKRGFLDRTDFSPAIKKVHPEFRESDI